MDDPVEHVLAHLDGVRRLGAGWTARCPAHEDRHASLSVGRGWDGRALLSCHAGCATEVVVEAVRMTMSDLFPSRDDVPTVTEETVYNIDDAQGRLQARHVRRDAPGEPKRVSWQRPTGAWGLDGRRSASLPLYGSERLAVWDGDGPVFLTEGEKAADAVTAAGRRALATVSGAATVPDPEVLSILAGRDVILSPDNDPPGAAHMREVASSLRSVARSVRWLDPTGWPERGDLADVLAPGLAAKALHALALDGHGLQVDDEVWTELETRLGVVPTMGRRSDITDRTSAQQGSVRSVPPAEALWPEIEPLQPDALLPPFPVDLLPAWMAGMVIAVAANTETDLAMAAVTALGLASVPLSNRYAVQARVWTERGIHLFTASIADSGELKSAVFAALDEPLRRHERERQAEELPGRRDWERDRKDVEARAAILRDELKKAMKAEVAARAAAGKQPEEDVDTESHEKVHDAEGQVGAAREQLRRVEVELDADAEEQTAPYALLADDATQEALQRQMAQQDGRVGIVSPESELFPMAAGRYSDKTPNLQVYLSGFSGEPLRPERITREAPPVDHPGLAIVIATQPVVLEEARRNAYLLRRGLLARFLFAVPASHAGTRHLADRPAIPVAVEREYREALMHACRLGDARQSTAPIVLHLSAEAGRVLERWHDDLLEPRRDRERGDLGASDAMVAWAGRLHGLVLRIAGLLHVVGHLDDAEDVTVEPQTMAAAIGVGEWAIEHAYAAFGIDRLDSVGRDALRIRRWYLSRSRPMTMFSVRDAQRGLRGLDADRVRAAIGRLEEHGYVRMTRSQSGPAGGRPTESVTINPADSDVR